MVLSAPGVGKSAFCLNWAARSKVRALYLSADTDSLTMSTQLAALATGHPRERVEARMQSELHWRENYADAIRSEYPDLVMDYSPGISLNRAAEQCEALAEVWGEGPQLLVIDTASNVRRRSDDYGGWDEMWQSGAELAGYLKAVVVWAHHLNQGAAAGGNFRPNMNEGQFKPEKYAEVVMSLHRTGGRGVELFVHKNRSGISQVPFPLIAEHDRALVREKGAGE